MTAATLNTPTRARNGAPLWQRIAEGVLQHAVLLVLSVVFLLPLFALGLYLRLWFVYAAWLLPSRSASSRCGM